jgi:hypothetical protein
MTIRNPIEATTGWALLGLVGGPAGVLEWSLAADGVHGRIAQAGAWSPSFGVMGASRKPGGGIACQGAVGNRDALAVCAGSARDARLFSAGGAWLDLPIASAGGGALFTLASDGTDYRVDYPMIPAPLQSAVLHAGAWSNPVGSPLVSPLPAAPQSAFAAGSCGHWTILYPDSSGFSFNVWSSKAMGAAPYPQGARLLPQQEAAYSAVFASWPGEVDALWTGSSPTSKGVSVLYVALGL